MRKSKEVQETLRNPPRKEVDCSYCEGSGIINRRGMVVSDPCPRCSKTGKVMVIDYKEFEKQVREIINLSPVSG